MRQVLAYRDRYQITDPADPLGQGGHEGERGDAYAVAARAMASITAAEDTETMPVTGPGLRCMTRVPVVLAEAQARANERWLREADERARRDCADRGREHAASRSW